MLGNDVVDLNDPETWPGARHARFDARVFGRAERDAIARSADGEALRWMLWAAKEAAYKALRRARPDTVFSPRRFAATLAADGTGRVRHADRQLAVRVERDDARVHALAADALEPDALAGCARIDAGAPDPGRAARALALRVIARRLHLHPSVLRVERRGRAPQLLIAGAEHASTLSLSHHGAWVAFAWRPLAPVGALS